ncbi:hypothetical protein EON63_22555 [archaeon]|nr:MAG: hypothetical protein EON63_22555 [archaeon]
MLSKLLAFRGTKFRSRSLLCPTFTRSPSHLTVTLLNMSTSKTPKKKAEEPTQTLEEIRQIRLDKASALRSKGMNPYAYSFDISHQAAQLQQAYRHLQNGQEAIDVAVSLAGRVMVRRVFGKLAFFEVHDESG